MAELIRRTLTLIDDPAFRRVLLASIALSLLLALGLGALGGWGLANLPPMPWAWADWLVKFLGGLGLIFGLFFIMIPLSRLVAGFFADHVADAVEARYYPGLRARRRTVLEDLGAGLRFLGVSLGLNLLALPVYLIPVLNLFVFFLLNGYLLGREYFELAALRHHPAREVRAMQRRNSGRILVGGMLIAAALSVPVANFAVPLLATALMVHLYQGLGTAPAGGTDT